MTRVLYVEDNEDNVYLLKMRLERDVEISGHRLVRVRVDHANAGALLAHGLSWIG